MFFSNVTRTIGNMHGLNSAEEVLRGLPANASRDEQRRALEEASKNCTLREIHGYREAIDRLG